ncbi:hypothetical protein [Micromonospora sp. IBHARD004]|uniref:hypothetical protein n=1 Tax=Micromonospora sp. IBHARD004 TaxID=3457764 RepID=UPI00405A355E
MSEFEILVGRTEDFLGLERLLRDVRDVLGMHLREMPEGSRRFWGELGDHRIYVNDEFAVNGIDNPTEPFKSHPCEVIVDAVDDAEGRALADRLYEALKRSGDYRLILLEEGSFVRSTHFPEGEW